MSDKMILVALTEAEAEATGACTSAHAVSHEGFTATEKIMAALDRDPEALIEQVARAIAASVAAYHTGVLARITEEEWANDYPLSAREEYTEQARAAVAVLTGEGKA